MSDNCQAERQEIARLQQANCRLQRNLDRKQRAIESAYNFALAMRSRAIPVLSHRSGVARGKWSWHKGAYQVADGVIQRLGGEA